MELIELKQAVHNACLNVIKEKIDALNQALKNYQDAANEETKSSAGDKYETGRAMMHLEKEKIAGQLDQAIKQLKVLSQINPQTKSDQVGLGSLVKTNKGWFYISVSLGAVDVTEGKIMCISPVAPLSKSFEGTQAGASITFNKINYSIVEVC